MARTTLDGGCAASPYYSYSEVGSGMAPGRRAALGSDVGVHRHDGRHTMMALTPMAALLPLTRSTQRHEAA